MRLQHNILEAIFIQGRLEDLIAFFVMFKERDQFAALHLDIVGIQADVVPETVVFGKNSSTSLNSTFLALPLVMLTLKAIC